MLILTPLYLTALGADRFGMLQFTQRLAIFGGLTNLGATSFLKIQLSALSKDGGDSQRRALVGECLQQSIILLPTVAIYCVVGLLVLSNGTELSAADACAIVLLLAVTPLSQWFSIPQVALFAHGLGYRGGLITTVVATVGQIAAVGLAWCGFGLPGVAIAMSASAIIVGVWSAVVARRHLPWFGVEWPAWRAAVKGLGRSSGAAIASLTYLGLQQVEVLTYGYARGASELGRFVLTCVIVSLLETALRMAIAASPPGIAHSILRRDTARIGRIREEFYAVAAVIVVMAAPLVIAFGPILVNLWVQRPVSLGREILVFALCLAAFRGPAQFDAMLLDQAGHFHRKTIYAVLTVFVPAMLLAATEVEKLVPYWYWMIAAGVAAYWALVSAEVGRRLALRQVLWPQIAAVTAIILSATLTYAVGMLGLGLRGLFLSAAICQLLATSIVLSRADLRRAGATQVQRLTRLVRDVLGRRL
jgi:O-antigen/teichoic acid export membrane protein